MTASWTKSRAGGFMPISGRPRERYSGDGRSRTRSMSITRD
jgi:hypothetical protein